MILGEIQEGAFKGKRLILEPREGLKMNEYYVEKGIFMNGAPEFSKACLIHGVYIPDNGCDLCQTQSKT